MSQSPTSTTLGAIAQQVGGRVVGDPATPIAGVAPLHQAGPTDISFLASAKADLRAELAASRAAAVVLADPADAQGRAALVVADPVETFDRILAMFPTPQSPPPAGVDASAHVDPSARLGDGVAVGCGAVIQAGCAVGDRSVLWPNVFVGRDCRIGAGCVLHPGVVLREQTELGDRVIIHPNAVLGADGYGYRQVGGRHVKVPQVGRVVIGDDVEIGANVTIDRAKCGATTVGRGSKIDNLCQIAHNVQIGEDCLVMALCGIAGSVRLEHHAVLAGHVGLRDNIRIGAGAIVTAFSGVGRDLEPGAVVSGVPARDHRTEMRAKGLYYKLPELFKQVERLAKRLEAIERAADNS